MQLRLKTTIKSGGKIMMEDLPFPDGQQVEVIIEPSAPRSQDLKYPLRGKQPFRFDDPFTPAVPHEDWDALRE
jgi:hypothetical protein